jgi:tetratricopeptide (TPR) repeat protein
MLFALASMVARRANLNDQALAFAMEAFHRNPTAEHLCLVGYGHRELGDLDRALAAFVEASSIDRGSVAARLDTFETLASMGKFLEAAQWATSVLGVDPNHNSAASRAAYYRARANDS